MNLTEYVKSFPRAKRCAVRFRIASALGVSEVYVRSMCNGQKNIPAKYAIAIELATNGLVSRHITAPDFYPLNKET